MTRTHGGRHVRTSLPLPHVPVMRGGAALLSLGVVLSGCADSRQRDDVEDASLEETLDASTTAPVVLWRNETVGPCPRVMTPVFNPPTEPEVVPGAERWSQADRVLNVRSAPTLLGTGLSLWSLDAHSETPMDHATGELGTPFVMDPTLPAPDRFDTLYRYRHALMALGESTVVSRTPWELIGWTAGMTRGEVWPFREIAWLRRAEEADLAAYRSDDLDHAMPAWSPVTGQVAFAAGLGTNVVAVQCPPPGQPQFVLDFRDLPREPPYRTALYYRENGELVVVFGRALWIVAPDGTLLRRGEPGVFAEPIAYDRECGMLLKTGRRRYEWWNLEEMSARVALDVEFEHSSASGTYECGLIVWSGDGATVVRPDSSSFLVGAGGVLATRSGYLAPLPAAGLMRRLDFSGTQTAEFSTTWTGHSVLTPTGSAITPTARWELGVSDVGCLARDCGLNWAHTNSPLPE